MTTTTAIELLQLRVTPAMARTWLEQNYGNRKLRRNHVLMLAREIASGRYVTNGQTIIFASSGRLLDGQHRLAAVIVADQAVDMLIVRGVDEATFHTLDQGMRRQPGDELTALGVHGGFAVASAARLLLLWTQGLPATRSHVPKSEIINFVMANRELEEAYRITLSARKSIPTSGVIAVYWLGRQSRDQWLMQRMDTFVLGLATGADLTAASPILALRNTAGFINQGAKMSTGGWFGLTLQAWNAFARGTQLKNLRHVTWPDECMGYPHPRGHVAQAMLPDLTVESASDLGAWERIGHMAKEARG
jgi:hypothetical protein